MVPLHCWVILGDNGTRKGSLIRSLAGVGASRHCDIMLSSGESLRFWTAIRSGNEPADALPPEEWVNSCVPPSVVEHPNFVHSRQNILIAFRLNLSRPGFEAEDYLNTLAKAGAIIESIVTLGQRTPDWVREYGVPYAHVPNVDLPTNQIGQQVRRFWGWR